MRRTALIGTALLSFLLLAPAALAADGEAEAYPPAEEDDQGVLPGEEAPVDDDDVAAGELARTGMDTGGWLAVGVTLLFAGALALGVARKPRRPARE